MDGGVTVMPTRDDVFRVLAGIARGARGGIMQSRENDRQDKQDEIDNLLRDFQMKRAQADAEWTDTERYGSPDVGASADRLAAVLQPSVTADSPYRGPTARGPGGMVGVPRREAPPEDPLAAAISGVSRPSLRMVNGRMRDPSTSRRALDRTERLQDMRTDRTADREEYEARKRIDAKFAPPPAPKAPVRGTAEYLAMLDDELGVRDRHEPTRDPNAITPTDVRQARANARTAQRDLGVSSARVQAARVPALSPDEFTDPTYKEVDVPRMQAAQRRKTADSTVAEVEHGAKVQAVDDANSRLREMGLLEDAPPADPKQGAIQEIEAAKREYLEAIEARPDMRAQLDRLFMQDVQAINQKYGIR